MTQTSCDCFDAQRHICKHIVAVQIHVARMAGTPMPASDVVDGLAQMVSDRHPVLDMIREADDMTRTPSTLTRKEIERLESSLAITAPEGVAPEDFARVIHWAWRARVLDRRRDQALLDGVLDGEFEIAVGGPNWNTGPASDRRLMFWTPPPPEVRSHDQVYESHVKYLNDVEIEGLTRLRDRWRRTNGLRRAR